MGQCKACGIKGFFVSTKKYGVCSSCINRAKFDFNQRYRIISESQKIISESNSFKTILHRIDTLIEHAKEIAKYEAWGMSFMTPSASDLILIYSNKKNIEPTPDLRPGIPKGQASLVRLRRNSLHPRTYVRGFAAVL